MKQALNRVLPVIDRISYLGGHVPGVLLLVAIVALVTLEVTLRYVFHRSTLVADEFSAYFFVGLLYFGSAYALQKDRHITITVLVSRLSSKQVRFLNRIIVVINVVVAILLSWQGWGLVITNFQHKALAATVMATPLFIPMLVIPLGTTILALQAFVQMARLWVSSDGAHPSKE